MTRVVPARPGWPWAGPSNRQLRKRADRRFKRRKQPPDTARMVLETLAELGGAPAEGDAAASGEERKRP